MTNPLKLKFGLPVPDGAVAAWGARAIYKYNPKAFDLNHTTRGTKRKRRKANYFDVVILGDRMDSVGDEATVLRLCKWFDETARVKLVDECNERYISPESGAIVTFTEGSFSLIACPNKSHGYLYITLWVHP